MGALEMPASRGLSDHSSSSSSSRVRSDKIAQRWRAQGRVQWSELEWVDEWQLAGRRMEKQK